jgi:hypothetical protein
VNSLITLDKITTPIRHDGKIWTGTATFTANKPIEVGVEHKYNRYNATIDAKLGTQSMPVVGVNYLNWS